MLSFTSVTPAPLPTFKRLWSHCLSLRHLVWFLIFRLSSWLQKDPQTRIHLLPPFLCQRLTTQVILRFVVERGRRVSSVCPMNITRGPLDFAVSLWFLALSLNPESTLLQNKKFFFVRKQFFAKSKTNKSFGVDCFFFSCSYRKYVELETIFDNVSNDLFWFWSNCY